MTQPQNTLNSLIRSAVGTLAESIPSDFTDWESVIDMSFDQGVAALSVDGYNALPGNQESPLEKEELEDLKYEWFGSVLQEEVDNSSQKEAIASLAAFYQQNGIRMMLLKGYGLSLNWPIPNHRPTGDIDIYLFGKWREADKLLSEQLGIEIDNSHHHHSVFVFRGFTVENHYDFINRHSHRSNVEIERNFKRLAEDGGIPVNEMENVYYPSDMLNMLFVARHNACHFAAEKITLRMVLDWAFLVKHVDGNADFNWPEFWQQVEQMGMLKFVLCLNSLCVTYLGFAPAIFHEPAGSYVDSPLVERMLKDIFEPENTGADKRGISYLIHRTRLWLSNGWKNKMVYSDSMLSTFYYQLKSHLMKPKTIFGC